MVEMTTNTWGQYVTKLESSAFDLHLTTANAGQTVSLWQNGHILPAGSCIEMVALLSSDLMTNRAEVSAISNSAA